ncbi:hypothetical protein GQ457_03G019790 [Hibiscus cannabinus]
MAMPSIYLRNGKLKVPIQSSNDWSLGLLQHSQLSLLLYADFKKPGNWGFAIFACFREGVSELCSLVYSGGLSKDLSEFIVEIQDPNKSFQKEIKIVIFLRFMLIAFSPVNRKRRSSFRCLTI